MQQQLEQAKKELILNQNRVLLMSVWVMKLYLIMFAVVCATTIKTHDNVKQIVSVRK